jgi:NADH-quinone oxidoreductase subunit H
MVLADLSVGVLFVIASSSLATIAVFMAGWSSNNKYSLLGAMRSVAMFISYEVPQVMALLAITIFTSTMSLSGIVNWQEDYHVWFIFLQPLAFLVFLIAGAVEVNRSPTDISEAESEIVAGYHTEYSGIKFGFFYVAEYFATFGIAAVGVTLFLGGWTLFGLEEWIPGWMIFLGKVYGFFFLFIWSRGTLPRLRIDQLMSFAWKFLLPLSLVNVLLVGLEVLLWQENSLSAGLVLPIFAIVNFAMAGILVYAGAKLLRPLSQPAPRVRLMREVGAIVYGQEAEA